MPIDVSFPTVYGLICIRIIWSLESVQYYSSTAVYTVAEQGPFAKSKFRLIP
eukprot:COSAG02_NODE_30666_length_547_cov_0.901786_1_plen_51_part_01